jgi:hypothetical protein
MPENPGRHRVNRNFALPPKQAEWLRTAAFMHKTSQAKLVREALDDLRAKYEGR